MLDLQARPYDPRRPVVRSDGQPRPLIAARPAGASAGGAGAAPGRVADAYRRRGTADPFLGLGPPAGRRRVAVTARRTARDFARRMNALVEVPSPAAAAVAVVLDSP